MHALKEAAIQEHATISSGVKLILILIEKQPFLIGRTTSPRFYWPLGYCEDWLSLETGKQI